jgi:hypothetical protein
VEGKVVSSAIAGDVTAEDFAVSSSMAGDVPIFSAVEGVATSAKYLLFSLPLQELILTMVSIRWSRRHVMRTFYTISQCSEGRRNYTHSIGRVESLSKRARVSYCFESF